MLLSPAERILSIDSLWYFSETVDKDIAKLIAMLLAFSILLTFAASKFAVLPFDLKSYHELQEEASPLFSTLMQMVSYLGETKPAATMVIIAAAIFALQRRWIEAIFIIATTSSTLIAFALKDIVQRTRPFPISESSAGLVQGINQYSYPSGHVLFFVVFFGFFAYLASIHFTERPKIIAIIICALLIALIGPSRIFLGAHWASDVLGSYVLGTLWLFFLVFAYNWAISRKHNAHR